MRAAREGFVYAPMPCATHAVIPSSPPSLSRLAGALTRFVRSPGISAVDSGCKALSAARVGPVGLLGKENDKYLRVDGVLSVPAVTLEHPYCRSAVHLCKAHELADGSFLLRRVCWRHLESAPLFTLLLSVAVRQQSRSLCADSEMCGSETRETQRGKFGSERN